MNFVVAAPVMVRGTELAAIAMPLTAALYCRACISRTPRKRPGPKVWFNWVCATCGTRIPGRNTVYKYKRDVVRAIRLVKASEEERVRKRMGLDVVMNNTTEERDEEDCLFFNESTPTSSYVVRYLYCRSWTRTWLTATYRIENVAPSVQ